jgi:hypothetical protein
MIFLCDGCVWYAKKWGIGQDNFSCTVFDFKFISEIGQIGCQGIGQKPKYLCPTEPRDNFLSSAQVV